MLNNIKMFGVFAQLKLREIFTNEKGEVNIVAIVILIGIAVALALIFRKQIESLITTLLDTITNKATDAVNGDGQTPTARG